MNTFLRSKACAFLCVLNAAVFSAFFAANASAQDMDTAYVPFRVNVNATATAQLAGGERFEKPVRKDYTDTLLIITEADISPVNPNRTLSPVTMHNSRGRISLELSRQLYRDADIALYSLNGKQILHGKAAASEIVKSISHPNVAMGVYVLSVRGMNGNAFTSRLAHVGGGMNVSVAFMDESFSSVSLMEKAIPGNWTITVSAEGYLDISYAFTPVTGRGNILVQNITLRQSSSSTTPSSSSGEASSSPSAEPLTCGTVPASGYATRPITPPTLTCGNGGTATGISWLGSPVVINWDNPKDGTYSNIGVTANCGTATNLIASCPGTLTVKHIASCSMASTIAYEGTAITPPVLACSDGSVPFDIVFSGYLPNWDNPVAGSYAVLAEANCGQGTLPAVSCGTLTVNPVTLVCGSVPASRYEGIEINPPDLTCSHGIRGTPTWTNAPNWSNPDPGPYSNISVTATCGLATKTANCNGTLTVNPVILTCSSVSTSGISGTAIYPPTLTCNNGRSPTDITWPAGAPNWSNPAVGTYSNINVIATCGLATRIANCNGTLTVNPVTLTCYMSEIGISGFAIGEPYLTCDNGKTPANIIWSANAPNWSNPAVGTYSNISATATCGTMSSLTANCGSLSVSCSGKDNTSTHYCSDGTMKEYDSVTYQGQTYKTVVIGTQTWMAENLNYAAEGDGGMCYNRLDSNCGIYGRLYNWQTAITVCPSGWHLPTKEEWEVMTAYIGSGIAGKLMATSGWSNNGGGGTNRYGFSALPGGQGYFDRGYDFSKVGEDGYWWIANEYDSYSGYWWFMRYNGLETGNNWVGRNKSYLHSVRCIKD